MQQDNATVEMGSLKWIQFNFLKKKKKEKEKKVVIPYSHSSVYLPILFAF